MTTEQTRIFVIVESDTGLSPHFFTSALECDEFTSQLDEPFTSLETEAEAKEYFTATQMNELSNRVAQEFGLSESAPKDKPVSARRFLKMLNMLADNVEGKMANRPAKRPAKKKAATKKTTKKAAKKAAPRKATKKAAAKRKTTGATRGPRDKRFTPHKDADKLLRVTNASLPAGLVEDKFSYVIVVHPEVKKQNPRREGSRVYTSLELIKKYDGKSVGDFVAKERETLAKLNIRPMSTLRSNFGRGFISFKKAA